MLLIFTWGKIFGGPKYFWSKKCILKSALFRIFHQFLRFTSNDHSSVICWGRTILSTSFENLGQRAIQILFWILSNIFGRCQKIDFKNVFLANSSPVTSDQWHRWGWLHSIILYCTLLCTALLYCNVLHIGLIIIKNGCGRRPHPGAEGPKALRRS